MSPPRQGTVIGSGGGAISRCYPDGDSTLLAFLDIHHACQCTWVPKGGGTLMVRKYAHALCPASSWHRRREGAMQS